MNALDYILDAVLVATIFLQFRGRRLNIRNLGLPIAIVVYFLLAYLKGVLTAGHDLYLIGGGVDCYSFSLANRTKYGLWKKVSFLNERHGLWAMLSLVSVGVTDAYVRFVASGLITDFRIF